MDIVRWAVLGAGDVCERKSGPPLYQVPGSELALVFRRDREAGESFVSRHGHGTYVAEEEHVYNDPTIDAVYVATPHALHAEQTIRALEAGKHVLVEKPMALNARDCDEMIKAANSSGKSLGVAYYRRAYRSIQEVLSHLDRGTIGNVTQMYINNEFPTSHRVDLVHHLLGRVESVRLTEGSSDGYDFNTKAPVIELSMECGTLVRMAVSWLETGMPEALKMVGTQGSLFVADLKGGETVVSILDEATHRISCRGFEYTHYGLIENFVRHLVEGDPLACSGEQGRLSTVIMDLLQEAQSGGEWLRVKY